MKKILAILIVVLSGTTTWSQLSIPSMEVSLLGGYSLLNGSETSDLEGMNFTGSLLVHINENIAVGPFFSRGIDMNFSETSGSSFTELENDAEQSLLGLKARLSTNRNGGLRPYLSLSYFRMELVEDFGGYRLAQKTSGLGLGLGLMVKINRNLYVNAIDVSARQIGDDIFFLEGANYIFQFQAGISYNFGKSK